MLGSCPAMGGPQPHSGSHDFTQVSHAPVVHGPRDLFRLSLGALGVVYGDIGTSPLYAIKECFSRQHGVAPSLEQRARHPVAGVLVADLDRCRQVPLLRHARRQPWRGRHPGAARAGHRPGLQPEAPGRSRRAPPLRADRSRALRRGAAARRRHDHAGDLGARRARGSRGGDAGVQALRRAAGARHPGRACSRSSAAAPPASARSSVRRCCSGSPRSPRAGCRAILRGAGVLAAVEPAARGPVLRRQRRSTAS